MLIIIKEEHNSLTPFDIRIAQMLTTEEFEGTKALPPAPAPTPRTPVVIDVNIATPVQVALAVANGPMGKWFVVCQGRHPGVYASW